MLNGSNASAGYPSDAGLASRRRRDQQAARMSPPAHAMRRQRAAADAIVRAMACHKAFVTSFPPSMRGARQCTKGRSTRNACGALLAFAGALRTRCCHHASIGVPELLVTAQTAGLCAVAERDVF